jgi:hypothetical protein
MSAHRHQATWRDIVFNRRYLDTGTAPDPESKANIVTAYLERDFRLRSMDPTPVNVVDLREARQFLEGAEPNQVFEGSRLIRLVGEVAAPSHAILEDMTAELYESFSPAACRMAFAANDPPHVGPFGFKRDTDGGVLALRAYCRPSVGRPVIYGRRGEGTTRPFEIRLVAYDPKFYAVNETSTPLANLVGGNNSVANNGNLATDPRFEIVLSGAGHAAFTLSNTTTGHAIVLNLSALGAGTYTLDVLRATFTKADGTNCLAKRVSGFPVNLWLATGNNVLTVTGNTNLSSVTAKFRDAYA